MNTSGLIGKSEEIRMMDPVGALQAATKAAKRARPGMQCAAYLAQGAALRILQRLPEAAAAYRAAGAVATTMAHRARLCSRVATLEATLGNDRAAIELAERSVRSWCRLGNRYGMGRAMVMLGVAHHMAGRYELAADISNDAVAHVDGVLRQAAIHNALYNRALAGDPIPDITEIGQGWVGLPAIKARWLGAHRIASEGDWDLADETLATVVAELSALGAIGDAAMAALERTALALAHGKDHRPRLGAMLALVPGLTGRPRQAVIRLLAGTASAEALLDVRRMLVSTTRVPDPLS